MSEYFPKSKSLGAMCKMNYIHLFTRQKQILKMQQVLVHRGFLEAVQLDIDKSEKVPNGLNSWKSKADKLDIAVSVDLSKLNDVVKNDVIKRIEYDELVIKVNTIQNTDSQKVVKKCQI